MRYDVHGETFSLALVAMGSRAVHSQQGAWVKSRHQRVGARAAFRLNTLAIGPNLSNVIAQSHHQTRAILLRLLGGLGALMFFTKGTPKPDRMDRLAKSREVIAHAEYLLARLKRDGK